ncbi:superfamily II DNA/RNA helicase [Thermocatellispora tengchongensis]|uniref:Superfamily II DNA/RNA helicase n=1 Tax=Thermocatellispora tengchongensis TaxID=1073253 RepID=A0A840PIL1_9ACTN|nr:DEAD/DEAH box helicase [Thermocatellispora tengchongensis]MBB5135915.1 superfamily II DNA/RNA helicase [Thermocatellispora tengchongensis]
MLDAVLPETTDGGTETAAAATEPQISEFALLGLPRPLVSALARQGITSPFEIQRVTIPDILGGNDVLGRGQTGSGKTLAFGLPTLARVAGTKARPGRPLAVILVPTRELALQVHDALEPLGRGLSLRMKTVVGGMSMGRQIEALRRGVEVVVATPGRLTDLIQQGECSLADVQVTVLDEADHMCDLGFFPVVTALLEQTPPDGQRLLFSATLDGDVDKLVKRFLKDPVTHSIAPATSPVDTMEHHVLQVTRDDKFPVTAEIANRDGRTILFVRTQHGVDRLVKQLARVGVRAGGLHGGKRQNQRTRILNEFREGAIQVLVCTDVAARGIHVDDVSLVLHVDPPQDPKSYLHRGGRTARAGERGTVMTLVLPNERRSTDALTRQAGIRPFRLKATPGHPRLAEVAGAQPPSGQEIPVWEPAPLEKPRRRSRDGQGGHGDRRPRRRHGEGFDGERRPRRHENGDGFRPRRHEADGAPAEDRRDDRSRSYGRDRRDDRPGRPYNGGDRTARPYGGGDRKEPGFRTGDRDTRAYQYRGDDRDTRAYQYRGDDRGPQRESRGRDPRTGFRQDRGRPERRYSR